MLFALIYLNSQLLFSIVLDFYSTVLLLALLAERAFVIFTYIFIFSVIINIQCFFFPFCINYLYSYSPKSCQGIINDQSISLSLSLCILCILYCV